VLLAAGERVVDVAPSLTATGRRRGRARGKDDRIDAIAIARLGRQEPGLPALSLGGLNADLKLLVDARDQQVERQGSLPEVTIQHLSPGRERVDCLRLVG
jgi:hypothetical protein